jgi:hypothetical protein
MYPQRELTRLAACKTVLRRNIALHRIQCAEAAAQLAQPLAWLDRALAFWRRHSPLAIVALVPLVLLIKRKLSSRRQSRSSLVRWGQLLYDVVRDLLSASKHQS